MELNTSYRLNGIGEYFFSQKLKQIAEINLTGEQVINLGIGSPDQPPHQEVVQELQETAFQANAHSYQGYRGTMNFRMAISKWYREWYGVALDPDTEILPLMGSKEGIMHLSMTFLNAGDAVLIPDPGYPTYRAAAEIAGASIISYPLIEENGYLVDFEALEATDLSSVKMMWVNYPHMPSGAKATIPFFERLIDFGKRHGILICHDNPYSFILNDDPISILAVKGSMETAVELNSLSKSHNMAGWRIGMLCGSKDIVNQVLRFKTNMDSGMFLPLQCAAVKALSLGKQWYAELNNLYSGRRRHATELLHLLNCTYQQNQAGMFIWARIPVMYERSTDMSDEILYGARVFITPGSIFGNQGERFVRISLCSPENEFREAIHRIKKWRGK
jgi:aspartate/methionine/tyrosine aminotransferase